MSSRSSFCISVGDEFRSAPGQCRGGGEGIVTPGFPGFPLASAARFSRVTAWEHPSPTRAFMVGVPSRSSLSPPRPRFNGLFGGPPQFASFTAPNLPSTIALKLSRLGNASRARTAANCHMNDGRSAIKACVSAYLSLSLKSACTMGPLCSRLVYHATGMVLDATVCTHLSNAGTVNATRYSARSDSVECIRSSRGGDSGTTSFGPSSLDRVALRHACGSSMLSQLAVRTLVPFLNYVVARRW